MNNKKLGTAFENEFCELLASKGWWAHFLSPSVSGSQPFDVIACKDKSCMVFDCKTSAKHIFPYTRLEDIRSALLKNGCSVEMRNHI